MTGGKGRILLFGRKVDVEVRLVYKGYRTVLGSRGVNKINSEHSVIGM
jgi:hypothetical protein